MAEMSKHEVESGAEVGMRGGAAEGGKPHGTMGMGMNAAEATWEGMTATVVAGGLREGREEGIQQLPQPWPWRELEVAAPAPRPALDCT